MIIHHPNKPYGDKTKAAKINNAADILLNISAKADFDDELRDQILDSLSPNPFNRDQPRRGPQTPQQPRSSGFPHSGNSSAAAGASSTEYPKRPYASGPTPLGMSLYLHTICDTRHFG